VNYEALWYAALMLASLLTVGIAVQFSIWLAGLFFVVAMLILMAMRPI
jgi:hypothetical protein